MSETIRANGIIKIGDYKFTSIEGGFGEDKKSMLVKDIAIIHNNINTQLFDKPVRGLNLSER